MDTSLTIEAQAKTENELTPVRFHMSLNVSNLDASIRFFRAFFGIEPAKVRSDYAKFEVDEPPLVLSLEPSKPSGTGVLNHVGLRMPNAAALVAIQRRLETCGVSTRREEGIECCYAKQTKFWLHDPDGTLWEVYTLDEDIDHHGFTSSTEATAETPPKANDVAINVPLPNAIWSHRLGQPFPTELFVHPASVDEIRLQGTLNMKCTHDERTKLFAECAKALRQSGKMVLHQLTSDDPIESIQLELAGAAAVVEQVLPIGVLVQELEAAGFTELEFQKFQTRPCFVRHGRELRETLLIVGRGDIQPEISMTHRVLFKGPSPQVSLAGFHFVRGQFHDVPSRVAELLELTLREHVIVTQKHAR